MGAMTNPTQRKTATQRISTTTTIPRVQLGTFPRAKLPYGLEQYTEKKGELPSGLQKKKDQDGQLTHGLEEGGKKSKSSSKGKKDSK